MSIQRTTFRVVVAYLGVALGVISAVGWGADRSVVETSALGDRANRLDFHALSDETTRLLQGYLRTDTTNPPGHETDGATYLQSALTEDGVASEIIEFAPGRGSLVARLKGSTDEPGVCLLSHIDTVTSEAERWKNPPLSGLLDEHGDVWGRGALDMKGMGAIEAMVMKLLAREHFSLRRDVVLLAVSDEEDHNSGIQSLLPRWKEIGCSEVVNEGGLGLRDLMFDGQTVYPITVGEKGYLWLKVIASGEPGHGSTPRDGEAPQRLRRALDRIDALHHPVTMDPSLFALLDAAGRQHGGLTGAIVRSPLLVRGLVRPKLMANPLTKAVLMDTWHTTGFGGAMNPNVVPSEAWAQIDARLLPDSRPEDVCQRLVEAVDDPAVRIEVLGKMQGASSPVDDPFYRALAQRVVEGQPDAVVGPAISPGFTDSIYLRGIGVHAYGLVPFVVDGDEVETIHGDDERVNVANLERGVAVLLRAVLDVAGGPTDPALARDTTPVQTPELVPAVVPSPTTEPSLP